MTIRHLRKVAIGELAEGIFDGPHATPPSSEQGPIFLGIANITEDGRLDLTSPRRISEKDFAKWTKRVAPQAGDIVFTYEATLNRYAVIPAGFRGCLGRRLALIRPRRDRVNYRFLHFYFFSEDWRSIINANILSGATVDRIPLTKFPSFEVRLPPLNLQDRIASILSAYDDLIENNTRRIAVLEEMARRVYEEWFVHLRFPGHDHTSLDGDLPMGWRRAPIKEAYDGLFDGPHATPAPSGDGPVFLGIGNICESGGLDLASVRHIAEEDYANWTKRVTPAEGDIVFTYEATLNRYALIPKGFRGCLGRRLALIRVAPEKRRNLFLYLHFFSADWRDVIDRYKLSGATVDRIPLSKLPDFPITLPPQDLIERFDDVVRPMFRQIEVLRAKNTNLRAQRDLLLPKLISGEIDVSAAPLPEEVAA